MPRFVQFLQRHDFSELQEDATWNFLIICSSTSEHTRFVIEAGAVPFLVELLASSFESVKDQAVWALGNIAGEQQTIHISYEIFFH